MDVGVLGVGRMGSIFARILARHPAVDRLLLAGSGPGRADRMAREVGVEASDDNDSLIRAVDAVVIASPTDTHPELIRRNPDAGIAVFCEKPIALDLATKDESVRPTTIGQPRAEMGNVAVDLLLERFEEGRTTAKRIVLRPDLVVRNTTAAPA